MKQVRLAAVRCCGRGALLAAVLAAAPLLAATKKVKESPKPPPKPTAAAPATPEPVKPSAAKPAATPSDDLYEGPAVARPKAATTPVTGEARPDAATSPGPKYADAWPSEFRKPEGDLQLAAAGVARAQAMVEYLRGEQSDKRGDADVALEAWKRAAALDPENADLAVKVAFRLAMRNEPGEAIRILKDAIALSPKDPQTHIYLAKIYAKHLNKPDLAIAAVQKAIDVAPDDFRGWAALYDLHLQAGEQKKATEVLDRALKSTSKEAEFWLRLGGKIMLKSNGTPTPDELRQMESAYRKAVDLKPNDASTLSQMGDFFAVARNDEQALAFYERATKLKQNPVDESTKRLPEKYADCLIKAGRITDALAVLEKLAMDTGQSLRSDLYERLGALYEMSGQVDKAIDHYRQTLVLDTAEPNNHERLAQVQLRAKRYDDAVTTMQAARKKFEKDPGPTIMLAQILSLAKRHPEALAMYEIAADEMRGRNETQLNWRFLESWAAAAEQGGKFDKAVELLKKCIADYPQQAGAYNDLGYLWVERGLNLEEAGDLIKKALEIEPKKAAYLDSLGWYYFKTGKFEDAKRELLNALAALKEENTGRPGLDDRSEDPTILEHVGDAYDKLGSTKEAVQYWERALKQEPDKPEKIQEKIDEAKKKLGT